GRRHTRCSRDWSSDVCSSDLRSVLRPRQSEPPMHTGPTAPAVHRPCALAVPVNNPAARLTPVSAVQPNPADRASKDYCSSHLPSNRFSINTELPGLRTSSGVDKLLLHLFFIDRWLTDRHQRVMRFGAEFRQGEHIDPLEQ